MHLLGRVRCRLQLRLLILCEKHNAREPCLCAIQADDEADDEVDEAGSVAPAIPARDPPGAFHETRPVTFKPANIG